MKNEQIRLTIITINLNNAVGLRKTIESVIRQNSEEYEYIIIDGGSTDGSLSLIVEHQNYLSYWESEPDRGIYHAMNKGILRARGEYCQFLNSGDYLHDANVTTAMLANTSDGNIVYGNKLIKTGNKVQIIKSFAGRKVTLYDMYKGTFLHAPTYIRKTLFEKYGLFDESLNIVSDWKFFLIAIGLHNEIPVYNNINVVWFDTNGVSSTQKELLKYERNKVLEEELPECIRLDYESFAKDMMVVKKIKKYKWAWFFIYNLYLLVNKIEVNSNIDKNEKVFS